jgi:nucleoside-diphosphate-sugar epimerase
MWLCTGAWRSTYGYVEDVADGIALAARHPAAARRIFNIGYANAPDNAAWALTIAKLMGWSGEFGLSERRATPVVVLRGFESLNFAYPLVADTRRIREELAYVECVEESDALLKTIEDELARLEL